MCPEHLERLFRRLTSTRLAGGSGLLACSGRWARPGRCPARQGAAELKLFPYFLFSTSCACSNSSAPRAPAGREPSSAPRTIPTARNGMQTPLSLFQRRQLEVIARVTPHSMAGHILNTTVLVVAVAGTIPTA